MLGSELTRFGLVFQGLGIKLALTKPETREVNIRLYFSGIIVSEIASF